MFKRFIRNRLEAMGRDFNYDVGSMTELLDVDFSAFTKFARVMPLSAYRKDVPKEVWHAVKLTGAMHEDCGPCSQLVITMAERDGVDAATLTAIASKDEQTMSNEVRLGVRFANAVLKRDPAADQTRDEIVHRWGKRALISLSFALVAARLYPTLKYALGYGRACTRLVVGGKPVMHQLTSANA